MSLEIRFKFVRTSLCLPLSRITKRKKKTKPPQAHKHTHNAECRKCRKYDDYDT